MKSRVDRVDMAAPLPLGYMAAVERAVELRRVDPSVFSWPVIAMVIREYHGFDRYPGWWARELRGRVPSRPRGHAFGSDRRAA